MYYKKGLLAGPLLVSAVVASLFSGCNNIENPIASDNDIPVEDSVYQNESRSYTPRFSNLVTVNNLNFSYDDGWNNASNQLRFVSDVNGDGKADILAVKGNVVKISNSFSSGSNVSFSSPSTGFLTYLLPETYPYIMADINGNDKSSLVSFGNYFYHSRHDSSNLVFELDDFTNPDKYHTVGIYKLSNFFGNNEYWNKENHIRTAADVNGDGRDDLVAFGHGGVHVALTDNNEFFPQSLAPILGIRNFSNDAGGWDVNLHSRVMADVNGDGKADIVGFGSRGALVSLSNGDGTFSAQNLASNDFGTWDTDYEIRTAADVNGDGKADIVAFGHGGVHVALAQNNGQFGPNMLVLRNFTIDSGWHLSKHVRTLADVNGDGKADIIGFGTSKVFVSLSQF